MNDKVLKDVKAISGFISSIMLSIIALLLVINHSSYWVVFIVLSMVILFFHVQRADKMMKHHYNEV